MTNKKRVSGKGKPSAASEPALKVKLWMGQIRPMAREWAAQNGIEGDPLEALAAAAGLARASLFNYVAADPDSGRTARGNPQIHSLILIAHTLGVSVDKLLTWQIVDTKTGRVVNESARSLS